MPPSSVRFRTSYVIIVLFVVTIIVLHIPHNHESKDPGFDRSDGTNKPTRSGTHVWREDGLLETNMQGQHPILELIEQAEKRWKEMHRRQSKTLSEAVAEYKRRNGYPPPAGFDLWWDFVKEHDVKLVDEFDQINYDITPYLALTPRMFHERLSLVTNRSIGWHFEILNSHFQMYGPRWWEGNERQLASMIMGFSRTLPDMEMHGPNHVCGDEWIGSDLREKAREKVANGTYFTVEELRRLESTEHNTRVDMLNVCTDSESIFRLNAPSPDTPTFLRHHKPYINPCQNPTAQHSPPHLFQSHARTPRLLPVFAFCKLPPSSAFLLPTNTWDYYDPTLITPHPWKERGRVGTDGAPKLFWRGETRGWNWFKGLRHSREREGWTVTWKHGVRPMAGLIFSENVDPNSEVEVLIEKLNYTHEGQSQLVKKKFNQAWLNKKWMDIGLVGRAMQCNEEEGTCNEMNEAPMWKKEVPVHLWGWRKFVLDLDGNEWSIDFQRKLSWGHVVLKHTSWPEWNSDWLIPYYHYIPVQSNFTDVYNIMAFFLGDPENRGLGGHDDLAERISEHAAEFARKYWRWQDMQAYVYRLALEYARLLSHDRNKASFSL